MVTKLVVANTYILKQKNARQKKKQPFFQSDAQASALQESINTSRLYGANKRFLEFNRMTRNEAFSWPKLHSWNFKLKLRNANAIIV